MTTKSLRSYADQVKGCAKPCQVGDDHVPTIGELNNITYMTMKYIARMTMRVCDFATVRMIAGDLDSMGDLRSKFVPVLGEFLWDHILGEPENPTVEDVQYTVDAYVDLVYGLDEKTRNDVGPITHKDTDDAKEVYEQMRTQLPPEVSKVIDEYVDVLIDQTGDTAKSTVTQFILKYADDKKAAFKTILPVMHDYDQTFINYSTNYQGNKKEFTENFTAYIERTLTNIWYSFNSNTIT